MHIKDIAGFLVATVLLRYVLAPMLGSWIRKRLQAYLIKTERDIIVWTHYQKRARGQGHIAKRPLLCNDERCVQISK